MVITCVAGLKAVRMLVHVKDGLIEKGEETLYKLLPRESAGKPTLPYCRSFTLTGLSAAAWRFKYWKMSPLRLNGNMA